MPEERRGGKGAQHGQRAAHAAGKEARVRAGKAVDVAREGVVLRRENARFQAIRRDFRAGGDDARGRRKDV